jgi:hypothetical protein
MTVSAKQLADLRSSMIGTTPAVVPNGTTLRRVGVGQRCFLLHDIARGRRHLISDEGLVISVLSGLHRLGQHARDRAAAGGTALLHVQLVPAANEQPIEIGSYPNRRVAARHGPADGDRCPVTCDDGVCDDTIFVVGRTPIRWRVREIRRLRRRVRIGAPDPSLTPVSGLVAVTELVDRLNMIKMLDRAIGPIKTRDRGFSGGELLIGIAAAQLAGEDFLVGLDRQRADAAGQVLAPAAGLCSTTAAGLARRFTDGQWHAVETGIGDIGPRCSPRCRRAGRGAV